MMSFLYFFLRLEIDSSSFLICVSLYSFSYSLINWITSPVTLWHFCAFRFEMRFDLNVFQNARYEFLSLTKWNKEDNREFCLSRKEANLKFYWFLSFVLWDVIKVYRFKSLGTKNKNLLSLLRKTKAFIHLKEIHQSKTPYICNEKEDFSN